MQISVADAKAQFSEVLRRAAAGEVIEVTRYGKTIAKVVAPKADAPPAETREEIRARRESAFGMLKGKVRYEDGSTAATWVQGGVAFSNLRVGQSLPTGVRVAPPALPTPTGRIGPKVKLPVRPLPRLAR